MGFCATITTWSALWCRNPRKLVCCPILGDSIQFLNFPSSNYCLVYSSWLPLQTLTCLISTLFSLTISSSSLFFTDFKVICYFAKCSSTLSSIDPIFSATYTLEMFGFFYFSFLFWMIPVHFFTSLYILKLFLRLVFLLVFLF